MSESKLDSNYLKRTSLAHKLKSISPEKIINSQRYINISEKEIEMNKYKLINSNRYKV